jgi:hypothetical protein
LVAVGSCPGDDDRIARVPCRRPTRCRAPAATSLASEGVIASTAAASARSSSGSRRRDVAAGDQVTVTDSHQPALRMAPAPSSRRHCPRANCTRCSSQRSPGAQGWSLPPRIPPLCNWLPSTGSGGAATRTRHQPAAGNTHIGSDAAGRPGKDRQHDRWRAPGGRLNGQPGRPLPRSPYSRGGLKVGRVIAASAGCLTPAALAHLAAWSSPRGNA